MSRERAFENRFLERARREAVTSLLDVQTRRDECRRELVFGHPPLREDEQIGRDAQVQLGREDVRELDRTVACAHESVMLEDLHAPR